ncbi:AMP-binding protein [Kitasatospora sp. NPDC101155]|uniref:AMP-binding protein n=1 Tax=Kitasatospora sp. NPDC101155 TaxID=3364097 RepID=UPI0037F114F8
MSTQRPGGPETHPVVRLLDCAVAARPDGIAIEAPDRTISYQELGEEVSGLAARLRRQGVAPQDRILIRGERSSHFVTALLATWAAGAVPAPVDGAHPEARIARYRAAARAQWMLSPTLEPESAPALSPALARLDDDGEAAPWSGLSHILFTSGTTGDPAAVAVGAEPLRAMSAWYAREFNPGPTDRVGLLGGLGHDPVLRDVIAALLGAATLVVPGPDVLAMPGRLVQFTGSAELTILHCTPALLEFGMLLGTEEDRRLPNVRLILCGGAPLPSAVAERTKVLCDTARLFNVYGTTETPQVAAAHELRAPRNTDTTSPTSVGEHLPIGSGVAGAAVLLGAELPGADLAADEIVVRSGHLALGYLDDQRAKDRFRPDPLGEAGYRLYLTGDLGARGTDGELYVTGRADRQISVNGYRVALQEIEAAATRHPHVTRAAAALEAGPRGDVLAITVTIRDDNAVTAAELRRHLRGELPAHAVPSAVRFGESVLDRNHKARLVSNG